MGSVRVFRADAMPWLVLVAAVLMGLGASVLCT